MNNEPTHSSSTTPVSPRTIALIGKCQGRDIAEALCLLGKNLSLRGIRVVIEELTARNAEGGGAVFEIQLPILGPVTDAPAKAPTKAPTTAPVKAAE